MQQVMQKAQELAEAILDSQTYQKMHILENRVTHDEEAAGLISALMEKRTAVQNLLSSNSPDPEELTRLAQEMEEAETAMNACAMVSELQESRRAFTEMMENVNRILRLVITGEVEDETNSCGGDCSSCGSCSSCGGCH